jgi:hypothetical protein
MKVVEDLAKISFQGFKVEFSAQQDETKKLWSLQNQQHARCSLRRDAVSFYISIKAVQNDHEFVEGSPTMYSCGGIQGASRPGSLRIHY